MIRFARPAALAAVLLATFAGAALAKRGVEEEFHWQGRLAPGRTLEVTGINGEIVAEPGTGDRVEVHAIKTGKRHDPSDVQIEVVEDAQGILVCAVYPGAGNSCERGRVRSNVRHNDVVVDFRIVVPAGVRFEARTVNGGIEATDLSGPVQATTVNGNCVIATRGSGEASTVNGSVRARIGRLGADDRLEFTTVNGSIQVTLPDRPDARFEGSTVNGSIRTEFPLSVTGRWGPRQLSGSLGTGAGRVKMSTVNGSIQVGRAARSS
jgi:hypothetical protein